MLPLSYSSLDVTSAKAMKFSKFLDGLLKVWRKNPFPMECAKLDFAHSMWQNPEFIAVSLKP
jgi:hypothetical protein